MTRADEVLRRAARLESQGYREIVLTGVNIHPIVWQELNRFLTIYAEYSLVFGLSENADR